MRDHGSLRLGGGIGERPWVSEARWGGGGGWVRDYESLRLGGRLGERPWVSKGRWEVVEGRGVGVGLLVRD